MLGLHLTADLHHCRCEAQWLTDASQLGNWCVEGVRAAGLQPVGQLFHSFPATVLLAESHVCLHTWPQQTAATLDVYVCNPGGDHSAQARALMGALINHFAPERTEQRSLDRGDAQ